MSDEIAQVVDLEYKGIYYLMKGTGFMISKMCMMIKFLHEYHHKKWLEKPGSCSWQKIQEASEGSAPILEFPKEMFDEVIDISKDPDVKGRGKISHFEYYCRKNNLRYCMMPDLNPGDDYIPVAVLSQEFGIHDEQIKSFMRKRVKDEEEKDRDYAEKIEGEKEALKGAEGAEKENIKQRIEEMEQAKKENEEKLKESKEKMEKGNVLDFADYIKQAEDTTFFQDMDRAKAQLETCGMVREYMPDECMYPIRDEGSIPAGRKIYYLQKCGDDEYLTVERRFDVDEEGIAYSIYKMDGSKEEGQLQITDKDCSKAEWEKRLSEFFKKTGLYKDQPVGVTKDLEGFFDYKAVFDENFQSARVCGQELSKEAMLEIEKIKEESSQSAAYAKSFYSTLTVPSEKIMPSDKQILSLEIEGGLVEGISLVEMDSDKAKISICSDKEYIFLSPDGEEKRLLGDEIITALNENIKEKSHEKTVKKGGR